MPRGISPNSKANLLKGTRFTAETAREFGKRGAKVSNRRQAEARTFAEALKTLLLTELSDNKGNKVTTREAIATALIKKALAGNIAAYSEIRDTLGEKSPETNVIIQANDPVNMKESIKEIKDLLGDI